MFKFCQLLLASILMSSGVVNTAEINNAIDAIQLKIIKRPLYKNVNQNFYNNNADVLTVNAGANRTVTSSNGIAFKWSDYASSWNEFKDNYGTLNLKVNMEIAFNWYNIVWSNNSLAISLDNITDKWIKIAQVDRATTQPMRWDATHSALYVSLWADGNFVNLKFKLTTWASNNHDDYYFYIRTKSVSSNTTFDYKKEIYSKLNQYVNNKNLNLKSDYSTSLLEEHNIAAEKKAIDDMIQAALGEYYNLWKPFIKNYAYSDKTNQATITVKFNDPNTNKPIRWDFKVTIKFTLSQNYWDKEFSNRLEIISGKIINPNDPNGEMIKDKPLRWQDKDVYSTTATVRFTGALDGSETMKVNGIEIQVIDNTFTFEMTDCQVKNKEGKFVNEYDILLEKHDLKDFKKIIASHQVKYLIKQDISKLSLKWYAWNPTANPDQNRLITRTLPNGDINPDYDREVNPKTGTKTQITWIKHKAEWPFPLDPLNKFGDQITNNKFDEGFLAEGSVSGMGIAQIFNDSWIKSVQRAEVDSKTLKPIEKFKVVESDNNGSYFSKSGMYLYILTDQKDLTSSKFIIIGQQWQDKYVKFLDVLNSPNVAVPFWSTLQGFHLKNYLAEYKQLNSKEIRDLDFEQVSSYWKEYVSDVKSQHISPGDNPGNNFDLHDMKFETIKMNKTNVVDIREEIKRQVAKQLIKTDLIYADDYELKPFDDNSLSKLLDYDYKGNALLTLNINALATSIKTIGTNKIKIMNNIYYDSDKVIDLKEIKFKKRHFNFSEFTIDKLKNWIFEDITQTFKAYKISLSYPEDYGVTPLDDLTLEKFLTSKEPITLMVIIYSQDNSIKVKNSTSLELINDPDAEIAPPHPPDPDPDPNPIPDPDPDPNPNPDPNPIPDPDGGHERWITRRENLIVMSIISILIVVTAAVTVFFKYHFKKGIGGKKSKRHTMK